MHPQRARLPSSLIVPIVGDAAIASSELEGRLVPVLIVDASQRPEVAELIRVHSFLPPGDATSVWAVSQDDDDTVFLVLRFARPMELEMMLRFSITRQPLLVEAVLASGGLCLQTGVAGDRLITSMDANRLFIDVPDSGFRPVWDRLLLERLTTDAARRLRVPRRRARAIAEELVTKIRKVTEFRMPQ